MNEEAPYSLEASDPKKPLKSKPKRLLVSVLVPSVLKPDMSHMRVARILAVQSLFFWDGEEPFVCDEDFSWNAKAEKKEREIAFRLIKMVVENIREINAVLMALKTDWDASRMSEINTSILRLAIGELLFGNIEKKVVINEAIEISKVFGEEKDYKFINAFLDKIEK